jgi:glutamate-5-semialdehyde dehydrogenase
VYVDRDADFEMAQQIVINSKCQRTGVCNTAETLLVHQDIAEKFLQQVGPVLKTENVELRCCENSRNYLEGSSAATDEDFRTEFLDLIMSVKTVANLQEAIDHINEYGSGHTDAIVTNSLRAANEFTQRVDSAAVHVNVSTRLSDGSEFGLGAEIGISTDKFHARGPCGLRELTSYKYVVHGDGQLK